MSNFRSIMWDKNTGQALANFDFGEWLYFEYHLRVNDVSRTQGILSPFKSPRFIKRFEVRDGQNLDNLMDVYFRPFDVPKMPRIKEFSLDAQFFVMYNRIEHLNDGRPRDTFIGRSVNHLLERVRIIPPQEPLTAPYSPLAPSRVPPHHVIGSSPSPIPLGAGAWVLPTSEAFDGSFPAPPPSLVGTSTAHRMCQIVHYAKTYLNTTALSTVTIVPPVAPAGLPDHPIELRYDVLLSALQKMSAASWHAWFNGELPIGELPVDFSITPDPSGVGQWLFETHAGGLGEDRTFDGALGGGSDPVILSVGNDNIIQPVTLTDFTEAKTRIYTGGKNDGVARDVIAVVDGDKVGYSPWFTVDHFIHSSKMKDFTFDGTPNDGIFDGIERGIARLREEAERKEYTMLLRLNRLARKGVNINVGDIISADLFGVLNNYQIRAIRHTMSRSGGVTISVELGELDGRYFNGADEFRQVINKQLQIKTDSENIGESS